MTPPREVRRERRGFPVPGSKSTQIRFASFRQGASGGTTAPHTNTFVWDSAMSESNRSKITVTCACGTTLRVPATAAGKRGRCPKCNEVFVIPEPQEELQLAGEDEFDALAEAASREGESEAVDQPDRETSAQACPQCGARVAGGAVLCVSCGLNLQTGKAVRGASARRANAEAKARRLAFGIGTFALGCTLSAAGALVGAGIWAGIAVGSGFEIGWIAWGLGAAAGFGMTMGYGKQNLRAGMAAVGFAVFGILSAKAFVFTYFTYPQLTEAARHVASIDFETYGKIDRIASHRSERDAQDQGLAPTDERRRRRLYETAADAAEAMLPEQRDQAIAEIEEWEAGAKWDEPKYARNLLVYARLEERFPQTEESDTAADGRAWRDAYRVACREVDAIPDEERLTQAKELDAARQHRANALTAAEHEAQRTANEAGLWYEDPKREALVEETLPKYEAMPDADLAAEVRRIEAWNDGEKWSDAAHIRNFLIYQHAEKLIDEAGDPEDETDEVSDEDWQRHYAAAVEHVDAIPEEERAAQVQKQLDDAKRAMSEALESVRHEARKEVAGNVLAAFFSVCFDWMDILFSVLAIGSAFGIATGSSGDE